MASLIKIRDQEGNIIEIPVFRGPKGEKGDPGVAPIDDENISTETVWSSQKVSNFIEENANSAIPEPTVEDAGLVIKVQEDGTYGLGEGGISEVSADVVTAGTFAGQVVANAEATANLSVAQVRNVMVGTEEPTDEIIASLNIGDFYFVKEA